MIQVNDVAPAFHAVSTIGSVLSSASFRGKAVVVDVSVNANVDAATLDALDRIGVTLLAVSCAPPADADACLRIVDESRQIVSAFGVVDRLLDGRRIAFVIDDSGVVRAVFDRPATASFDDVIEFLRAGWSFPSDRAPSLVGHDPGDMIADRYILKSKLGEGAIGEVWRAEHIALRQELAIKLLKRSDDPEWEESAMERFRFESQVAAKLSRKTGRVVGVHDFGRTARTLYLVMELVEGRTLEDEIAQRGPMSPADVGTILAQLAEALAPAHALGIVHRDLKPTNVLLEGPLGSPPKVKLADFGIAKSMNRSSDLDFPKRTALHSLIGSPGYMSPEQMRTGVDVDHRADIWALGVVLYEALTQQYAFDASDMTTLMIEVMTEPHTPVTKHRPDLPPTLDPFFDRCFAKTPEGRFASVGEMVVAYREALEPPPRDSVLVKMVSQIPGLARTRRPPGPASSVPWGYIALGASMLVLGAAIAMRVWRSPSPGTSATGGPVTAPPALTENVKPRVAKPGPTTPPPAAINVSARATVELPPRPLAPINATRPPAIATVSAGAPPEPPPPTPPAPLSTGPKDPSATF